MTTHSTPAGIVREYFESLRWLSLEAQNSEDPRHARRLAAIAIIQAVACVEVFVNLWFRAHVSESKKEKLQETLLRDLEARTSLEKRLATWPKRHLGRELDLRDGPGLAFVELKNLRNAIVHFVSTHETVHKPFLIIHGLADTSEYDALLGTDAKKALIVAESFVTEIFRLAGFDVVTTERALAVWIAKRGLNASIETANHGVPPWLAPHVER